MRPSLKSRIKQQKSINWSRQIKERDEHACRWCGLTNTDLQAAHVVPKRYSKTALLLDNGLTLCNATGCKTHDMHTNEKKEAYERIDKILGAEFVKQLWEKAGEKKED